MVFEGRRGFLKRAIEVRGLKDDLSLQLAHIIATYIARTADVYQSQREHVAQMSNKAVGLVTDVPSISQTETVAHAQEQTGKFITDSLRINDEVVQYLKEKTPEERAEIYKSLWGAVSDRSKNTRAKNPSESMLFKSIERMIEEAIAE